MNKNEQLSDFRAFFMISAGKAWKEDTEFPDDTVLGNVLLFNRLFLWWTCCHGGPIIFEHTKLSLNEKQFSVFVERQQNNNNVLHARMATYSQCWKATQKQIENTSNFQFPIVWKKQSTNHIFPFCAIFALES